MNDYFHRQCGERRFIGPGGVRCRCCNYFGKHKLNRATRRTMKHEDRKILARARAGQPLD